ncbi:MAG: PKD domain-containing protein, partial [Thermoanaerobaculia bacterium]
MRRLSRTLVVPVTALAAAWLARAAPSPTLGIEASPPNPSAGQTVFLRAVSAKSLEGVWWDFGDGQGSEEAAPTHAWRSSGEYTVRLSDASGAAEARIFVSSPDTLRLLSSHPFEIAIEGEDPQTGARFPGRAVAQTDHYGMFSFPELTRDAEGPDVVVKVLEAAPGGFYTIFWSSLTPLSYSLTIREVSTGRVAVHRKEGDDLRGGSDTWSFPSVPSSRPEGAASDATPRHVVEGPTRG